MKKQNLLITGGAGYIGSHLSFFLKKKYNIFVIDNLSNGSVNNVKNRNFFKIDITNIKSLDTFFRNYKIDIIIHLAALVKVDESVLKPKKYFKHNLLGTLNILKCMAKYKVQNILFSSTAAVYQNSNLKISESNAVKPKTPYGETKYLAEKLIFFYSKLFNLNAIIFRFFNVSGSDYKNNIGERSIPPTHFITILLHNLLREKFTKIFTGLKTKDKSGVRDYIHVKDICVAFKKSIKVFFLKKNKQNIFKIFNLGTGQRYSTYDVVKVAKKLIKDKRFLIKSAPKRKGDQAIVVCSYNKAKKELNWKPLNSSLENIIKTSYEWEKILFYK